MSKFDHPAYGPKGETPERPTETVTEVLVTENHHYYEVRLVVALPNYECGHRPSALDLIMESIDDDLMVLEFSESPVHLFTVKEVNQ
jgi:hypothetical protein